MAIFNLIAPHLPRNLRPGDLTVLLKKSSTGKKIRISIVDYVAALLNTDAKPTQEMASFHLYLRQRVMIPRVFQKNKNLIELL